MKNKITAMLLLCCLLLPLYGSADTLTEITDENISVAITNVERELLRVTGNIPSKEEGVLVTMQVINPEKSITELTDKDAASAFDILQTYDEQLTTDGGKYSFDFGFNGVAGVTSNTYKVRISSQKATSVYTKTFEYYSVSEKIALTEALNSGITASTLDEAARIFGLMDYAGYRFFSQTDKSQMVTLMDTLKSGSAGGSFDKNQPGLAMEAFCKAAVLQAFNSSKLQYLLKDNLFLYEDITKISDLQEFYEVYNTIISEAGRLQLYSSMCGKGFTGMTALQSVFSEFCMVYGVKAPVNSGFAHVDVIVSKNAAYLQNNGFDIAGYNSLAQSGRETAARELIAAEFSSLQTMKTQFNSIVSSSKVTQQDNNERYPTGTGGGGGGGGFSGNNTGKGYTLDESIKPNIPEDQAGSIFFDLGTVLWAKDSIEALYELGIVNGKSIGYFEPDASITREEFIKLLVAAFNLTSERNESSFTDVDRSAWYFQYVAAAEENNITNGRGDGTFGIGSLITREEIAALGFRVLTQKGLTLPVLSNETSFADEDDIAEFASEAIRVMQRANIINGVGDSMFAPKNNATRAQAAKIIHGLIESLKNNREGA